MEMKIKTIVAACAAATVAVILAGTTAPAASPDVTPYTTRIVGMDAKTVPGHIVYTYRRGNETWQATNAVQRMAVSTAPNRYSKLKLIVAAKQGGKWQMVKDFIAANNLTDEWNACQYIEDGNDYFVDATNRVVQAGVATDDEIKAILSAAIDRDV